ncbi:hypothetical protein ACFO5R_12070 [Halosolutus amylolyticus]|uniref:Uncharacterized protein n=1 Tax=Halosolutus amylolyticus TaxID=2932267 RepID=A0ABD5PPY4_9EURY|nr:hypothetical protein [Halosolutus amylolyticus]
MTPQRSTHDNDGVLTPDELQLDDDRVAELSENRYLVRSDGPTAADEGSAAGTAEPADAIDAGGLTQPGSASAHAQEAPHARDVQGLAAATEPHGVDITLKTDGEVAHHRATSNDVREVFVDLLTWYAGQLDDDMSPGDALRVMLAASDIEV